MIVVTGGPYSGKTTLVRALAGRGFTTVDEAAIDVIDGLNEKMGRKEQRSWRRDNLPGFQQMVLELQLERESGLEPSAGPVFLDRGIADGIAYFRKAGLEPPARMIELCVGRYAGAIVLDTLDRFDGRPSSGRMSDRDDSLRIGVLIERVYEQLGVDVLRLAATTLEDRLDAVVSRFR